MARVSRCGLPTFGSVLQLAILDDLETVGKLADDAAVLLINKDDLALAHGALASSGIRLTGLVICRVVRRQIVGHRTLGRRRLPIVQRILPAGLGGRSSFEKRCALRQNSLEGVDVLLDPLPA